MAELVHQAHAHALYRSWDFSGVARFGDPAWRKLPTLSKEDLRDPTTGPLSGPRHGGEVLFYSSGTTGLPKLTRYGAGDLDRVYDLCVRFARLEGVGAHSRVMALLPMALWTVGKITVQGHLRAGAQVFPVDLHGGVEAWQRAADAIRPTVISSTPSVLSAWAPHYRGRALTLVETTGETLLHSERHAIEASFGCFVHDAYGLSECVVGVECRARHGFHFWPDAVGVEILEEDGNCLLPPGETGEVVVTSFMQALAPILRYRTGDRGRIPAAPCICGAAQPRVEITGRIGETYALPRGVKLRRADVLEALAEIGCQGATVFWKPVPGSPAALHVAGVFRPAMEIRHAAVAAHGREGLERALFAALPELAELVHEGEVDVRFAAPGGVEA
ncbi:MAG: AMP-binding protein [Thermodesulfobacteriota bacterium]